jgi:hypothetical protein
MTTEIEGKMKAGVPVIVTTELMTEWFSIGPEFKSLAERNGYRLSEEPESDDFMKMTFTKKRSAFDGSATL